MYVCNIYRDNRMYFKVRVDTSTLYFKLILASDVRGMENQHLISGLTQINNQTSVWHSVSHIHIESCKGNLEKEKKLFLQPWQLLKNNILIIYISQSISYVTDM